MMTRPGGRPAFTLIELLVVVSIIAALIAILVPSLRRAREHALGAACSANLRTLGQGLVMYVNENAGRMVPSRMPKVDSEHWQVQIEGGLKYRPTFLAMMGSQVGIQPFADPQPTKLTPDRYGEPGDQQNYVGEPYVCPAVSSWTDERNGCYGYNYHFLGNSRLRDSSDDHSFKNWPVQLSRVRTPSACVGVADSMGTAAAFERLARRDYVNNIREVEYFGNEGFNLDPPALDPELGEVADHDPLARSSAHDRHRGKANILWLDGHVSGEALEKLGYDVLPDGAITHSGNNRLWTIDGTNKVWLQEPQYTSTTERMTRH